MTEKMLVTFWGTRGSIPTPGRSTEKYGGNTACVTVEHGSELLIFDAGSGIRPLGIELARKMRGSTQRRRLHLFFSHTHWDHIQGLPFFLPAFFPNVELCVYGSPKKADALEQILGGQMASDYFPVDMSVFDGRISFHSLPADELRVGQLTILWQEQVFHPGGSLRFRITVDTRAVVYASDVELDAFFKEKSRSPEAERYCNEYTNFIRSANLLIADGQYTTEEYESRRGWGHTTIDCLLEAALAAGVEQTAIFHHDPERSDQQVERLAEYFQELFRNQGIEQQFFWAREGMTLGV